MDTIPLHSFFQQELPLDFVSQEDIPLKKCKGPCGQSLPATVEYFRAREHGKYGVTAICKVCESAIRKSPEQRAIKAAYDKEYRVRPEVRSHKRVYHREYNRHYYQNPENRVRKNLIQKRSKSRPEFQESQKVSRKIYERRPEVREHIRIYERNRPFTHPERQQRIRANRIARYHTPEGQARHHAYVRRPDIYAKHLIRVAHRRALKKTVPGTYTFAQIQEQLRRQHFRCYYAACGFAKFKRIKKHGKWEYKYHIEHTFPISRIAGTGIPGNDMGYIVLACPSCNDRKHDKFPWEWSEGGRLL